MRRSSSTSVLTVLLTAGLVSSLACTPQPLVPTDGDIVPSQTAGRDVVAGWTPIVVDGVTLLRSPALRAPTGATRVAAILRQAPDATLHLLVASSTSLDADEPAVDEAGEASWQALEIAWRDDAVVEDTRRLVARADLAQVARSVWLAVPADEVDQLRSLTWEAMVPMPSSSSATETGKGVDVVAPSFAQQGVLNGYQPRSAWGARAPSGCSSNTAKTKITVHHTVQRLHAGGTASEFAAEIRSAQSLHMDGRGYCDIGYHFLVSSDGTVWEGRNANSLGAHTGNNNTNNLGVSFVGCFHPTSDCNGLGSTTPPQSMINGAGAFIGTAARHYGITLTVGSTLLGHRDNPGQSTACPGDNLRAKLGELRTIANGGGGGTTTATGKIQGVVWDLSITTDAGEATAMNAKLPGAVVKARQGSTVVGTSTARASDAYWSFDLAPGSYSLVASKDGFETATRTVTVASGDNGWASIGVAPTAQAVDVTVTVVDADTNATLIGATVVATGVDAQPTDEAGQLRFTVPPGSITITASAEGYVSATQVRTAAVGTPLEVTLALDLDTVPDPGEGEGEPVDPVDPEDPVVPENPEDPGEPDPSGFQATSDRVVIRNTPQALGGCTCASGGDTAPMALGLLGLALLRRRRRR